MKNKLKLLVVFVLLLLPCVVLADMDAPTIKPYEMVVAAQDGVDYYDSQGNVKGHLNKDDKVIINYEFRDSYQVEINGERGYQLKELTGLVLVKEEMTPADLEAEGYSETSKGDGISLFKVTSTNNALVYATDGVDIRKGPSKVYAKLGHVDKDQVISYSYALKYGGRVEYIYVDVSGTKGWIEILDGSVFLQNTRKYITYKEVQMSCTTIPKNTVLSPKYISDVWTHKALVEYGSCKDTVDTFRDAYGVAVLSSGNYIAEVEMDIYEGYDQTGEKLGTIPVSASFVRKASVFIQGEEYGYVYVTYDGKTGWAKATWASYKEDENNPVNEEAEKEVTIEEETEDDTILVDTNKETNPSPIDYVSMWVIVGLSVALIAAIVVILVNRKKKVDISE